MELKREISYINYKDLLEFKEGEEQLNFFKQLLVYYEGKKKGEVQLPLSALKLNISTLKKIEEDSFECFLRLLDVNYELRNTIIGAENRKAIYYLSQKYLDLYATIEELKEDSFREIEKLRENMVKEYYEIMRNFSLPSNKLLNFRLFVQKKIESRMYEAQFLKLQASNPLEVQLNSLEANCAELKRQYLLSLKELISIVNYYKTKSIKYQAFFSFELEKLISYLRENYLNIINIIFKKLSDADAFLKHKSTPLSEEEIEVILTLEKEKVETELRELKVRYSTVLVPLVSSFEWGIEKEESRHCFNLSYSKNRYQSLKQFKNQTVESFIKRFEVEREKIENIVSEKKALFENLSQKITDKVNEIVEELREECSALCADLLRENQYFWARHNAEFNSRSRECFVKLYCDYSPYINSWKEGDDGWMKEYLKLKINLEYLKKIGSSVKEFSPEGKFYEKCSSLLDSYSSIFRSVCIQRDQVELDSLIQINTIPKVDYTKVEERLAKSLDSLRERHDEYLELTNRILKDECKRA